MMILSSSCILFFNDAFTAGLVGKQVSEAEWTQQNHPFFLHKCCHMLAIKVPSRL